MAECREILNEQGLEQAQPAPSISSSHPTPTASSTQPAPSTSSSQLDPTASSAQPAPSTSSNQLDPTASSAQPAPSTSSNQLDPTASSAQPAPSTSSNPTSSSAQFAHSVPPSSSDQSPAQVPPARTGLSRDSPPTDQLRVTIAGHVINDHLTTIAEDVGIKKGHFSQIIGNNPSDTKAQILNVLSAWCNREVLDTQSVVDRVYRWIQRGFVDEHVWPKIQKLVNYELPTCPVLPQEIQPIVPDEERLKYIQKLTKQSLRTKPFSLSVGMDWTTPPRNPSPPLSKVYTELSWTRKHRKAYTVEHQDLQDITRVLDEEQVGRGPVRVLVQGEGGVGKSTAMKHLAISWADGTVGELNKLDLVFHIALKQVRSNMPLETIIINQHSGLNANRVKPEEIKAILEGLTQSKVLLIIDGHDEYKKGINTSIDDAIEKKSLWNCWLILTSRETEDLKALKEHMEAELEIKGFTAENIAKYAAKTLGPTEAKQLLTQAEEKKIYYQKRKDNGILGIPLFLNMICSLYSDNRTLPATQTKVMQAVVDRCVDREVLRKKKQKDGDEVRNAVNGLGQLAWEGLRNPSGKTLIFTKDEVIEFAGEEALDLGLLVGVETRGTGTEMFTFHHLLFQQYLAGNYAGKMSKSDLEEHLPTGAEIVLHPEVVRFACGSTDRPDDLLSVVCDRLSTHYSQLGYPAGDTESGRKVFDRSRDDRAVITLAHGDCQTFLQSLKNEVSVPSNFDPLHNEYCNFIDSASEGIFVPSRFYVFNLNAKDRVTPVIEKGQRINVAPALCAITAQGRECLERTAGLIQRIEEHQPVYISHLVLRDIAESTGLVEPNSPALTHSVKHHVNLPNWKTKFLRFFKIGSRKHKVDQMTYAHPSPVKRFKFNQNTKMVILQNCPLSQADFNHIAHQLHKAENLDLLYINRIQLPDVMCSIISRISKLIGLYLEECQIEASLYKTIAEQLQTCRSLQVLSLKSTPGVPVKLGAALGQKKTLKELNLFACGMSSVVSKAVLTGASKCLDLQLLNLLDNTLTDHVVDLLGGDDHPGFLSLEDLNLSLTSLSEDDVRRLGDALYSGKLPSLYALFLHFNALTNRVGLLLNRPGSISLGVLAFDTADLSAADLVSLTHVIESDKLPKLKVLFLTRNKLSLFERGVRRLVECCVNQYGHSGFRLCLGDNDLSDPFVDQLKALCQGTGVELVFEW